MRKWWVVIWLFVPIMAHAEHVFELGLHGGVAAWYAQTIYVNKKPGLHAGAHLYYGYLSPHVVGFRTGLTFDYHQSGLIKWDYEDAYSTIDVEDQQMDVSYKIGWLNEQYTTYSLGIPLQLSLTRNRFSFLVGPKLVFPLRCRWTEKAEDAALSVYYPDYDNRIYESFPLAASRSFNQSNEGQLSLPTVQWWLAAELNYAFPVSTWADKHQSYIMIGVYVDFCLSKIRPTQSEAESLLMLTDTRDGFPLQRIMTPMIEANRQGRRLVGEVMPYEVGLKISYSIVPATSRYHSGKHCNCL